MTEPIAYPPMQLGTQMTVKLPPVRATVSMVYHPDYYLQLCQEYGEEPTMEGWLEYVDECAYEDFNRPFCSFNPEITILD